MPAGPVGHHGERHPGRRERGGGLGEVGVRRLARQHRAPQQGAPFTVPDQVGQVRQQLLLALQQRIGPRPRGGGRGLRNGLRNGLRTSSWGQPVGEAPQPAPQGTGHGTTDAHGTSGGRRRRGPGGGSTAAKAETAQAGESARR